jgi:outer membrane immunogenic protein
MNAMTMKTRSRRLILGLSLLTPLSGLATAADLAVYKARPPAPVPVWSWTGFYGGANIGYGWDQRNVGLSIGTTDPATFGGFIDAFAASGSVPQSLSPSARGAVGGLQIGYNWQTSATWLFGVEADIQGAGIKGSETQARFPQFFDATSTSVEKKIEWFGTVRARLGVLPAPWLLLYATGGLAYGKTAISFNTVDRDFGCITDATLCATGSSSSVKVGWTAGGGIEALMWNNWTFKAEYLYVDLGSRSVDIPAFTVPLIFYTPSTDFREHIVRVGVNYHFNPGPVVAKY